jgi:hypothetical protein
MTEITICADHQRFADQPGQHRLGSGFSERHPPLIDGGYLGFIHVQQLDVETVIGEHHSEGKAHMPATADHHHILCLFHQISSWGKGKNITRCIHFFQFQFHVCQPPSL